MSRRQQNSLTLEVKQSILKEVSEGVMRKTAIAAKYGIAKSTLSTILKSREKIEAAYSCSQFEPARKRLRTAKNEEIESALLKWICEAHNQNLPVTGKSLQEKARFFAEVLGATDFLCSNGWLQRFKQRHGIVLKKVYGDETAMDSEADSFFIEWTALVRKFAKRDIFYVNKTGLYYKAHPNCTLTMKGLKCSNGECRKERLTVLAACSIDGSKKLPLLTVGRFANPRCLRNLKTMPVCYSSSKTAYITADIFSNWLTDLDRDFTQENKKVCLIVNTCGMHCEVPELKSIKCMFLPPDVTAKLRPCVQGIIRCLKLHYRIELLRKSIQCFDDGSLFLVDLLDALVYLRSAWKCVSPQTIRNCFRNARFINNEVVEAMQEPEPEMLTDLVDEAQIRGIITVDAFKEYICMDDDIQASEVLMEEEIYDTSVAEQKQEKPNSGDTSEEVNSKNIQSTISLNEASDALRTLQHYIMEQNNSSHVLDTLDDIEYFWRTCSLTTMKENSIVNFCRR